MAPIDHLKSVLCDLDGKCCIAGSDDDRATVDEAIAALEAQQAVPEGYVLVPIEPTEKMIVDLMCTGLRHAEYKPGCDPTIAHMAQGYTAMIAAAAQGEKP